jgi:hypothetical protein
MIFPCDYAYTYQFMFFKKIKSVLKMKKLKKMALPPCGTEVGAYRHGARRQGPGAVPRGPAARGALLPPYPMAAGT